MQLRLLTRYSVTAYYFLLFFSARSTYKLFNMAYRPTQKPRRLILALVQNLMGWLLVTPDTDLLMKKDLLKIYVI